MPKSGSERTKTWREKRRLSEDTNINTKIKKSRSEIVRDSRERSRARANLLHDSSVGEINNEENVPSTSTHIQSPRDSCVHIDGTIQYSNYNKFKTAHNIFNRDFVHNPFGSACIVCDRLWFKNDLKSLSTEDAVRMQQKFPEFSGHSDLACTSCRQALRRNHIPTLSKLNGFKYPPFLAHLPKLDSVSERLISPRIPFMQIRRLRHVNGQFGILGQVINVPVDINTMVNQLPINIDDDHCINDHIKRKKIHRSSYLTGWINKRIVKVWLKYLVTSPLYQLYDIKVDESFFGENLIGDQVPIDEISEDIPIEESILAQQHTLLWNDDKYLRIAYRDYCNLYLAKSEYYGNH